LSRQLLRELNRDGVVPLSTVHLET
jgi:hypothetical protein